MADRLAKNLKEEYLSCTICLDIFRDPRRLSCDHVFCRECLANHARQTHVTRHFRNFITCPLCRDEIQVQSNRDFVVQEWVENLPKDTLVQSLIQTLDKHSKSHYEAIDKSTENVCNAHDLKPRDAFCMSHSQLICWECASRDHTGCEVTSSKEAHITIEPKLDALKQNVREQLSKAQLFSKNDTDFDEKKRKTLNDIDRVRNQLTEVFNSAMKQTEIAEDDVRRLNNHHLDGRMEFYQTVATLFELESTLQDAQPLEMLNTFAQMREEIKTAQKELDRLTSHTQIQNVVFRTDEKVADFLKSFSSIGFVDTVDKSGSTSTCSPDSRSIVDAFPSSLSHILQRQNQRNPNAVNEGATSIGEQTHTDQEKTTHQRLENDFNASIDKEEGCFLNGVLTYPNSENVFYVLDRMNEKIKQFNIEGVLLDFLELSGPPHDWTFLEHQREICITQPDEQLLTFVRGDDLVLKRYASTAVPYNGVCNGNDDSLVVSSWSAYCVDLVNLHGHVLRHFPREELAFGIPNLLCTLPGGSVAMTEVGKEITCVLPESGPAPRGKLIQWQYAALDRIYGICSDVNGLIYACVKERNEIVCIDADGRLLNPTYLSETDGLMRPIAVGFIQHLVIVAEESGTIRVFRKEQ